MVSDGGEDMFEWAKERTSRKSETKAGRSNCEIGHRSAVLCTQLWPLSLLVKSFDLSSINSLVREMRITTSLKRKQGQGMKML
jgi:hypothetical protein